MSARDGGDVIFRGINMIQANELFLRRDGENNVVNDIDLDSHKLINVADPTDDKDAVNKEYVDTNAGMNAGMHKVDKGGDSMHGNLLFTVDNDDENS